VANGDSGRSKNCTEAVSNFFTYGRKSKKSNQNNGCQEVINANCQMSRVLRLDATSRPLLFDWQLDHTIFLVIAVLIWGWLWSQQSRLDWTFEDTGLLLLGLLIPGLILIVGSFKWPSGFANRQRSIFPVVGSNYAGLYSSGLTVCRSGSLLFWVAIVDRANSHLVCFYSNRPDAQIFTVYSGWYCHHHRGLVV
jgi:hypothetical protein